MPKHILGVWGLIQRKAIKPRKRALQNIDAWLAWDEARAQAMIADRLDLIEQFKPKDNAHCNRVEKCTKRLMEALKQCQN